MRDAAKVGAQTSAVIKSTGGAANVSAKQVSDLAERLSLVAGADDEVIQRSQNLLLTFTKVRDEVGAGNKIFTEGSKAIVDMAAAMAAGAGHEVGQADLKSATIQVGKALQDPIKGITALSRVGVTFTEKEKEKIAALVESGDQLKAQKIILGELRTEFKGSARANADSLDRLSVAFDNLFEKAGEAMAPTIERLSSWLVKFIRQMQNGKGAGGDFVDSLKDIASTLGDIWDVAKKIPPEVYALMGITVAGVKINRAFGGLPGKALGGLGKGVAGKVVGKATPIPVFVTNPGFGAGGGGLKDAAKGGGIGALAARAAAIAKTPVVAAGARLVPVVGAAGILYYVFSRSNRNLPTGAGEPMRRSAERTPSGGRNVGEDLAPSPNATRKVEGMGDALRKMAARARDLIPTVHKSTENLKGFRSAADKGADAANRNSKRLDNLKDSARGFGGASDKATGIAKRLRDRIQALGGTAKRGETDVGKLRDEIDRLKSKAIKIDVGISIADLAGDVGKNPFADGWGVEDAIGASVKSGVKSGKINPFGFITGMGGAGDLMGADPAGAIYAAIGSRFGLAVSSGLRPGAITNSGNTSLHASGRALDIAGSTQGMLAFARFLSAAFGSRLKELIHTPMGWSIKNGARVAPYAAADHYDHVHVGFRRGGKIPGLGAGDKVPALLEPGEHVFTKSEVRSAGGHGAMFSLRRALGGGTQAGGLGMAAGGKVGPGGIPRTDWRMVKSIASRYGVDPLLLVAIGKIETDWGRLGDGRNGNVLGVGSYDTGSSYQWAGLRNQLRKGSELLKSWGATTLDAVVGGKASSWATDPGWESAVASKYREIATPHWARNAQVVGDDDAGGGGTSGGISWTTKGGRVGKKTRLPEGTTFFKSGAGVRVNKGRIVARTEASAAGRERWRNRPTLGGTYTYESELAQADRILDRAGDIDPTNKRDVAAVGGKLLLLGNRKAAIKRRLRTIRKALKGRLSRSARSRLLGEQAQLISELGGIESTSRELHESMHPEAGEDTAAQAAEDQAAATARTRRPNQSAKRVDRRTEPDHVVNRGDRAT